MSSFWKRVPCDQFGVRLSPNERVIFTAPNVSLSLPSSGFGEVGTFVLTDSRFVFLIYMRTYALSIILKDTVLSSQSSQFPNNSRLGSILFRCAHDSFFSVQGEINTIQQLARQVVPRIATLNPQMPKGTSVKTTVVYKPEPESTGIQKITNQVMSKSDERSKLLQKYTKDFESLKQAAESLKEIARSLSQYSDNDAKNELNNIFLVIGTEDKSSSLNSSKKGKTDSADMQLASQFANMIAKSFKNLNESFMTPAEAFVIFNKARLVQKDAQLVSPEDVNKILKIIEHDSSFPIQVEIFPKSDGSNGKNRVIVEKGKSFKEIANQLSSLGNDEFTTSFKLSKQLGIKEEIVRWYLERAVDEAILVLDTSFCGNRYYKNRFSSFKPV